MAKTWEIGLWKVLLVLPREKMLRDGITSLTMMSYWRCFCVPGRQNGFSLAKELLQHFGSLYGLLTADLAEFKHVEGIGVAKYAQLKGIAELARRFYNVRILVENPLLSPEMTRDFLQSQLRMQNARSLW
jgi:DNA repair protein RadC